jgi:hypothetical protein
MESLPRFQAANVLHEWEVSFLAEPVNWGNCIDKFKDVWRRKKLEILRPLTGFIHATLTNFSWVHTLRTSHLLHLIACSILPPWKPTRMTGQFSSRKIGNCCLSMLSDVYILLPEFCHTVPYTISRPRPSPDRVLNEHVQLLGRSSDISYQKFCLHFSL